MYSVDLYARVRLACHVEGKSQREAARIFGIDRKTVAKILKHSVPPGYQRSAAPARPKLDPFVGIIDQILEADKAMLKKQRHTAKRIFERLRDEYGYVGGITIVTDYVRDKKHRSQEVFVPLIHHPGHAQVDFGEAQAVIGGEQIKIHYFALTFPHSDAVFVKAYPAETWPRLLSSAAFHGRSYTTTRRLLWLRFVVMESVCEPERSQNSNHITCLRINSAALPEATIKATSRA